jgi:hypothetical protein
MARAARKVVKRSTARAAGNQDKILGAYKQMLTYQFGGTVGLAVIVAIALWINFKANKDSPPLLPLVVAAGMLGALFSSLIRLYHVDEAGPALITRTVQYLGPYLIMYSLVPPVIGAISATVIYLMFVGKFLQGGLFPVMDCLHGSKCETVLELMKDYWPKTPPDYGKALVWAFIAGFSERFVPNLLQSLAAKQEKAGSK